GPEWFSACLGVVAAGAVAVPLDTQLDERAPGHALKDSGSKIVFTSPRLFKRLKPIARRTHCKMVLLGDGDEGEKGVRSLRDLEADPGELNVQVSPSDRAILFYTSGTTGPPKGVPLTHGN